MTTISSVAPIALSLQRYADHAAPTGSFTPEVDEFGKTAQAFTTYLPGEVIGKFAEQTAVDLEPGDALRIAGQLQYKSVFNKKTPAKTSKLINSTWDISSRIPALAGMLVGAQSWADANRCATAQGAQAKGASMESDAGGVSSPGDRGMIEQRTIDLWFGVNLFLGTIGLTPFPYEPHAWAAPDRLPFIRREGNTLVSEDGGHCPDTAVGAAVHSDGVLEHIDRMSDEGYFWKVCRRVPWPQTFDEAFDTFVRRGWLEPSPRDEVVQDYRFEGGIKPLLEWLLAPQESRCLEFYD